MRVIFLHLLLSCFLLASGLAQKAFSQGLTPISIGHSLSIHSDILGEDRSLWIYVPRSVQADPKKPCPVVYLLDGESLFHSVSGAMSHLSETNGNAFIPEMILVGIGNTDRNRDLTPSVDSSSGLPVTGGGPAFLSFIEQELIPFVESTYPTHPYRVFIGHSLGGLMVMEAFSKHSHLFNAYIALDPSMWWKEMATVGQVEEALQAGKGKGKRLFVASAKSFPSGMTAEQAKVDATGATLGYRSVVALEEVLEKHGADLTWSGKYYGEESHGSVTLPGCLDGLRFTFDYYKRPSFAVISDDSPQVLESHYQTVSAQLGYEIPPPQRTMVGLAWRSRALEGRVDRALAFLQMAERYYPEGIDVHYEWAAYYNDLGDMEKTEFHYLKAQELEAGGEK